MKAWRLYAVLLFGIMVLLSATAWAADPPAPDPRAGMPTIESLLKELELPYVVTKKGEYKVVYTDSSDNASTIYVKYSSVGDLPEDQIIYLYTQVMEPPEKMPDPARFYLEMASYNDGLVVGRISVSDGYVFYSSSCWLRKVDAMVLDVEIIVAHNTVADAYEALQAVLDDVKK